LQKACFWQDYAGCSSVCQGECAGKPNQFGAKNHAFLFTKSYIVVVNQLHQLTPSPAAQQGLTWVDHPVPLFQNCEFGLFYPVF